MIKQKRKITLSVLCDGKGFSSISLYEVFAFAMVTKVNPNNSSAYQGFATLSC
jgi:hypothetical protein